MRGLRRMLLLLTSMLAIAGLFVMQLGLKNGEGAAFVLKAAALALVAGGAFIAVLRAGRR